MSNRRYTQFFYSAHAMPVLMDCNIAIGASGAVGTLKGPGISSVTRLAAGIYKVRFADNYNKLFGFWGHLRAPVTGADVAAGSLTPGVVYQITALGTTTTANWVTAGVPAGITPAVGVSFLCAATSAGTGTAKALGVSGITNIEILGDSNLQLSPIGVGLIGGYCIVKCLGPTAADDTALVATDPASGSVLFLNFYLSNSSVVVSGE